MLGILKIFTGLNIRKLILPLIIILSIVGVVFGVKYAVSSYENLQLENKRLTLEIAKLQNEITVLVKQNKDNIKTIETVQQTCEVTVTQVKGFYEGRESLILKEMNVLKNRKAKEEAIKKSTAKNTDGTNRELTDKEITELVSEVRIDSIYETYCNSNNHEEVCGDLK